MKLSYQCGLDPASMPTRQGKKFCESCQKQVYDLRRKSDERITLFYHENPTTCVIAYEDQLEKLPPKQTEKISRSHFPYAAGMIAVALLPTLTVAQENLRAEAPTVTIVPIQVPDVQVLSPTAHTQNNTKSYTKYYITGKVKLQDKKYRTRAGREITFSIPKHDSDGNVIGKDTLAKGTVGLTGKFRLKTSEENWRMMQEDASHLNVQVKGLAGSSFRDIKIEGNKISGIVHVRRRIRWVGKF